MMDLLVNLVDTTLATLHMDAVDAVRAFFVVASCMILSITLSDSIRLRFLPYGARVTGAAESNSSPNKSSPASKSSVAHALDSLAALQVPHSFFTHFYVTSVLASIFWAAQLVQHGSAFHFIAARIRPDRLQGPSMSIHQVTLCWALMLVQGTRRLSECYMFCRPSSSRMGIPHWLLGMAYYLAVAVSIWIEGTGVLMSHQFTLDDVKVTVAPSLRTFICLPIFLIASGVQHDCHQHLFSLKKYSLPTHPVFRTIVCPHYTAECAIYLSLALLAAPPGEFVNKTLLCTVFFVVVNLGVTAGTTKKWYMQKFGADSVQSRWNIIPGVY